MAKKPKKEGRTSETRYEKLDPTPAAIPLRFRRVESQTDRMRRIIQEEMSRAAQDQGMETFEEADDFDIPDDYDPTSPYEISIDQELYGEPASDQGSAEGEIEDAGKGGGKTEEPVQPSGDAPAPGGKGKTTDPSATS